MTQLTDNPSGHILSNSNVWSPDSQWIVYDTRSDAAGEKFDGTTIERVNIESGKVQILYQSQNQAHCGVATYHPNSNRVVFIQGPENPTQDWQYDPTHRQGVIVQEFSGEWSGQAQNLDARDLTPPFTPGALRGGSHVHVWDAAGEWVSFTYEDHILAQTRLRNIGVSVPGQKVRVHPDHPRNHDSEFFSVLVTRTTADPVKGSDEITRACEEGWVGTQGYLRADQTRQKHALAFQGHVITAQGETISEVFIVDLPEDVTQSGSFPLEGTSTQMPGPPDGTVQRRLTFTAGRKFPGLQGPRHWLRSSPDGSQIAFLMKDDSGIVQLWSISPNGGEPRQVSNHPWPITSAFSWSPDGKHLAYVADCSIFLIEAATGVALHLTRRSQEEESPRPEACVFSPDGRKIAFVRRVQGATGWNNQIFVVFIP